VPIHQCTGGPTTYFTISDCEITEISVERSSAVEDGVGVVQAELGNRVEALGGSYVNVCSGVYADVDTSQAVYDILVSIAKHINKTTGAMNQVALRAAKASADVGAVGSLVTGL
jgi:hypothetical protein